MVDEPLNDASSRWTQDAEASFAIAQGVLVGPLVVVKCRVSAGLACAYSASVVGVPERGGGPSPACLACAEWFRRALVYIIDCLNTRVCVIEQREAPPRVAKCIFTHVRAFSEALVNLAWPTLFIQNLEYFETVFHCKFTLNCNLFRSKFDRNLVFFQHVCVPCAPALCTGDSLYVLHPDDLVACPVERILKCSINVECGMSANAVMWSLQPKKSFEH